MRRLSLKLLVFCSVGTAVGAQSFAQTFNTPGLFSADAPFQLTLHNSGGSVSRVSGLNLKIDNVDLWQLVTDNAADNRFFIQYNGSPLSRYVAVDYLGQVGIGAVNPEARLDVRGHAFLGSSTSGGAGDRRIKFTDHWTGFPDGTFGAEISNDTDNYRTLMIVGNRSAGGPRRVSVWDRFEVNGNATITGNVGIGTTTPASALHVVRSGPAIVATFEGGDANGVELNLKATTSGGYEYKIGVTDASHPWGNGFYIYDNSGGRLPFFIDGDNGNVAIGIENPANASHKLAVNGTIRAKEVIVEANWADYVFAENYRLAPLAEVEAHIKAHKHLPGIPSATEVAEQGVSMGDMQAKLLAKMEEMTLHLIAQEKAIQALQRENTELRRQLNFPVNTN